MSRKKYLKKYYQDNIIQERLKRKQYYEVNAIEINEHRRNLRKERKKFIDNYKLSRGCVVCGYNKCAEALDFHHLDNETKLFRIARGLGSNSFENILEEINKCDVLCSNCHRELHVTN